MQKLSPDVHKNIVLHNLRLFVRNLRLLKHYLRLRKKLTTGNNIAFGPRATLMIPEFFIIGDDFSCGCDFFVQTNVSVGDECLISSDVSFVGNDHYLDHEDMSAYWSGRKKSSTVTLEGNNFIGYRSTIIGDVTIGEGAVVAAGSVVVRDVKPFSVVGGVPAKHIKYRFKS